VLGLVDVVPDWVVERLLVPVVPEGVVADELRVSDVPMPDCELLVLLFPDGELLVPGEVAELDCVDCVDDLEVSAEVSEVVVPGRDCDGVDGVCACRANAATKSTGAPHAINLTWIFMCDVV
jgi:hypothetical protein